MTYEKSCGAVVYTRLNHELRYVVTQSPEGYYGFPKGHVEAGETEHETALREIAEEVGLRVRLADGFRMVSEHPIPQKPGVMKQVVYFLAEYENQDIRPQPGEVIQARLMTFEEASAAFQFENSRQILRAAQAFLEDR